MPKSKMKAKRTRRKVTVTAIDPELHAMLTSHYRMSDLCGDLSNNLARLAARIDAQLPGMHD